MITNEINEFSRALQRGPLRLDSLAAWIGIVRKEEEAIESFFQRYNAARSSMGMDVLDEKWLEKLTLPDNEEG